MGGVGGDLGTGGGYRRTVSRGCSLGKGQGQRSLTKEGRGGLAASHEAGEVAEWVRPSARPGPVLLGPAGCSPVHLTSLLSSLEANPPSRLAWRAARTPILHQPAV